jgi:competence protein ComEC
LVIKIQYGSTGFLFTGDAEYDEEIEILDAGYDVSCTVLKIGHHGSSSSTSYRWLRSAAPQYAVISVGTGNSYGHPTEATLSRLRDADVITYRTDMQGDIICSSDGTTVTFDVKRNAEADTLADAGDGGSHAADQPQELPSNQEPTTSQGTKYILNTNTKKFHYPSCRSAKKISAKNRKEVTCARADLIEEGYSPCGNCDP